MRFIGWIYISKIDLLIFIFLNSMNAQNFGGPWTERKLKALENYLRAYLKIFTRNQKAQNFIRHYVDAFAGSGYREVQDKATRSLNLGIGEEAIQFMDGSVRKVLSLEDNFHQYWFVEKSQGHAISLQQMISSDFPARSSLCTVRNCDANDFLPDWCEGLHWNDRGVVFLDPYGMDVNWKTIERLAITEKVDLWLLFPSSSVIRLLPNSGPPEKAWSNRLTKFFGNDQWKSEFYTESKQPDLFDSSPTYERIVNEEAVANYLTKRLREIFAGVIHQPLYLKNSRNSTLFMLTFAAGNQRGASPAVNIARDIVWDISTT